jgi:protein gp37
MAGNSKIEWTDHTFNPWMGCTNVSPGCDNCYAQIWAERFGVVEWGNAPRKKKSPAGWREPRKWNDDAPAFEAQHGRRQRVFCASLADVFDNQVDPTWRAETFDLIRATPNLDWLLLTKRPQNIRNSAETPPPIATYATRGIAPTSSFAGKESPGNRSDRRRGCS